MARKITRGLGQEESPKPFVFTDRPANVVIDGEALRKKVEEEKRYCQSKVTGKFLNIRAPGKSVKLPYYKHVGDPCIWYELKHGQVYTIPRGFADQLNGKGYDGYFKITWIPLNKQISQDMDDKRGLETEPIYEPIYQFVPVDFAAA